MRGRLTAVFICLLLTFSGLASMVDAPSHPDDVYTTEDRVFFSSENMIGNNNFDLASIYSGKTEIPFVGNQRAGIDFIVENGDVHLSYTSGTNLYYGNYNKTTNNWTIRIIDGVMGVNDNPPMLNIFDTDIEVSNDEIHIIYGYSYYNQSISNHSSGLRYVANVAINNQQITSSWSNAISQGTGWTAFDFPLTDYGINNYGGSLEVVDGIAYIAYTDRNWEDCGQYISNIQLSNISSTYLISSIKDSCTKAWKIELEMVSNLGGDPDYNKPHFFYMDSDENMVIQVGVDGSKFEFGYSNNFNTDFDSRLVGNNQHFGFVEYESDMYGFSCCLLASSTLDSSTASPSENFHWTLTIFLP